MNCIYCCLLLLLFQTAFSQNKEDATVDTLTLTTVLNINESNEPEAVTEKTKKKLRLNNLPYFFDDLLVTGGFNMNGIYYSYYYKELSYLPGYQVGIENFYPILKKGFLHYGIVYAGRGLKHDAHGIIFRTHYLDFPLYVSYELPALQTIDFRVLFGTQFSALLGASQSKNYNELYNGENEFYQYNPQQFRKLDAGFNFGFSAEYKDVFFRVRTFVGLAKLMPNEQGMNNAFMFDVGYFPFRKFRK